MGDKVTGVMVYYYFVCKRKLWFFCHQINMESGNEDVMLGKILDDNSYQRDDKHINIDDVINIDFIREAKELHEVKKSRSGRGSRSLADQILSLLSAKAGRG